MWNCLCRVFGLKPGHGKGGPHFLITTQTAITVSAVIAFTILLMCAYINSRATRFTMNGRTYEQIGVMQQKMNGDELYIPVFKVKQ